MVKSPSVSCCPMISTLCVDGRSVSFSSVRLCRGDTTLCVLE
jgi:hypothetical protein